MHAPRPALARCDSASHRRGGIGQLLARAPVVRHVVDDDGLAHALDLARLEAVIGDVGGHEHHGAVDLERRAADVLLLGVVDVGAEVAVRGVLREVQQHRERLHAEIGVRLEPEAVRVLRELDPQEAAFDRRAERFRHAVDDARVLEGFAESLAYWIARHVLGVEVLARRVVDLALARDAAERGRREGQVEDRIHCIVGQAVRQIPMAIGGIAALRCLEAFGERSDEGFGADRHSGWSPCDVGKENWPPSP